MMSNAKKRRTQRRGLTSDGAIIDEVRLGVPGLGGLAAVAGSMVPGLSQAVVSAAEQERRIIEATVWCTRMNFDVMKLADMSLAELHRLFTLESHVGQPPAGVLWALCELAALKAKRAQQPT